MAAQRLLELEIPKALAEDVSRGLLRGKRRFFINASLAQLSLAHLGCVCSSGFFGA
jgi:hypothetical protein